MFSLKPQRKSHLHMKTKQCLVCSTQQGIFRNVQSYLNLTPLKGMGSPQFRRSSGLFCAGLVPLGRHKIVIFKGEEHVFGQDKYRVFIECMWEDWTKKPFTAHWGPARKAGSSLHIQGSFFFFFFLLSAVTLKNLHTPLPPSCRFSMEPCW